MKDGKNTAGEEFLEQDASVEELAKQNPYRIPIRLNEFRCVLQETGQIEFLCHVFPSTEEIIEERLSLLKEIFEDTRIQTLLGSEVIEDQPLVHTGSPGDLSHPCAGIPLLPEDVFGRLQDPITCSLDIL